MVNLKDLHFIEPTSLSKLVVPGQVKGLLTLFQYITADEHQDAMTIQRLGIRKVNSKD